MNNSLSATAACFFLAFLAGCKTQISQATSGGFWVDAINLQSERIKSFKAEVDGKPLGHGDGHDFGPLHYRVGNACGASGSKPKKLTVEWASDGKDYTKTIKFSKAASAVVSGQGEQVLVFLTEAQIPLVFIDARDPSDIGTSIFYNLAGEKLTKIEHDVLNLSLGFKSENVSTEMLRTTLKRWEAQMSSNIEDVKGKGTGTNKTKVPGTENETDTLKTESKSPE